MKPNAQQFFDIWCDAVAAVGLCRADPPRWSGFVQVFYTGVAARYGPEIAKWATSYLARLRADVQGRSII